MHVRGRLGKINRTQILDTAVFLLFVEGRNKLNLIVQIAESFQKFRRN